jgi:arabinofuranan 3-O-arabinosyltransferase
VPAAGHQTVAVLSGAASVTASSYGSWIADTQQEDPASAFDGNPATAWAEGSEQTPAGQWIQIGFARPMDLPASIGIRLLDDSTTREIASRLRVSTAAGSAVTDVAATGAVQPLKVVPGRTGWLRITIADAGRVRLGYPGAGISDVLIPGVTVTRLLQPAQDPAGRQAASTVFSFHQQVPSPSTYADPAATPPMARTFTLADPATLRPQASALAGPGPGLDALLGTISPPGPGMLQVTVASTPEALPPGFPASLITGSAGTPWTADTASPVIHLSWHGQRRIASLIVRPAAGSPSTPRTVEITSPDGTRQASIGAGGLVRFTTPLTTDRIDVSFPRVHAATIVSATGQVATIPVRLSQLSVPALAALRPVTPDERATFALACGKGPALTLDGRVYQTSVTGTIGELSQYLPLQVRLCSPGGTLSFGAGRHTLTAAPGTFAITDVSLASGGVARPGASRAVTIDSWQPDQRRVGIGPGAASYLEVHENYNAGWAAALNGRELTPVRLDGWQQGFIVPAGTGGTITLIFRPAATYHLALVVSLLAVVILLAITAWSFTGRARRGRDPGPSLTGPRGHAWLGVLGVTALIFVAGGPVALAVPVLAYLAGRPRSPGKTDPRTWLPWIAFGGLVASGVLSAAQPFGAGLLGPFGAPAQACALVALAAALTPAVTISIRRRPASRHAPADATPATTAGEAHR